MYQVAPLKIKGGKHKKPGPRIQIPESQLYNPGTPRPRVWCGAMIQSVLVRREWPNLSETRLAGETAAHRAIFSPNSEHFRVHFIVRRQKKFGVKWLIESSRQTTDQNKRKSRKWRWKTTSRCYCWISHITNNETSTTRVLDNHPISHTEVS